MLTPSDTKSKKNHLLFLLCDVMEYLFSFSGNTEKSPESPCFPFLLFFRGGPHRCLRFLLMVYRHVFCEPEKPENQFTGLDLSVTPGDHYYVQANSKYVSVPVRGGGGPILVLRHDQTGKIPRDAPTLCGHTGAVYDTKWNPFNDGMLYSTSDDGTVGIWQIPEEGLTQKQEAVAFMKGHGKPTTLVACNPVANNVVASASKDHTVKVWDAEKTEDKVTCSDFTGLIQDLVWDYTGKQLGTTCKDKTARIFDARQASVVHVSTIDLSF